MSYVRSLPYKPGQKMPYRLSRSKIELFMQCPRCFWLDVRLKISRPSSPPFNINKAIDDVWIDDDKKLIVVDYKATAKSEPVKSLGAVGTWHDMYRRQMEIYQWLLKQNGFEVSDIGYFVYATGSWAHDQFDNVVNFETHVFPHQGKNDWVDKTLNTMKKVMDSKEMPPVGKQVMNPSKPCEFCDYARKRTELTLKYLKKIDN